METINGTIDGEYITIFSDSRFIFRSERVQEFIDVVSWRMEGASPPARPPLCMPGGRDGTWVSFPNSWTAEFKAEFTRYAIKVLRGGPLPRSGYDIEYLTEEQLDALRKDMEKNRCLIGASGPAFYNATRDTMRRHGIR